MIALGKMSFLGLGVVAGIVSVMGVHLASAQSRAANAIPANAVVTADTDVAQIRQGHIYGSATGQINGPFIITDLAPRSAPDIKVYIVPGGTCSYSGTPALWTDREAHGMRLAVPTGYLACIPGGGNGVSWSGFIPY
ncbi:hypothetical protein LZC95_29160 [Pendulispora brunnea]|uniref:Uncharacterized protein n=1 Tax=Pendulispora brunnea TaxID=2905690 RepID=A0ABZ2JXL6_9BACT